MAHDKRFAVGLILALAGLLAIGLYAWRARGEAEASGDAVAKHDEATELGQPARETNHRVPSLDLGRADKASVSGRVLDSSGQPVAGAEVCAVPDREQLDGRAAGLPRCTTSEADGHYRLDRLWPVTTRVGASAAGFAPAHWRPRSAEARRAWPTGELLLEPGETREGLDITLERGGVALRGFVKDIAGGEIEGARVWSGLALARSDASGAFELWLAPGPARVHAAIEGYAEAAIPAVAPSEAVELFLTPESVLVGRVVDALTHAPLADVEVRAELDRPAPATRTDAEGRFRIEGLDPGSYTPEAIGEGRYGIASDQVHLGFGETSEEIVIEVHELAVLAGTIVIAGPERAPCPAGRLSIEHGDEGWTRAAAIERRDGHVEIPGLLPGRYRIEVECHGYLWPAGEAGVEIELEGSERRELEWEVEAGLSVRGEVVDARRGEPIEGVFVWALPTAEGEAARARQTYATATSLDDGSFALAGLQAGRYELHARGTDARPFPELAEALAIELTPGADLSDVQIVMPATGEVHGRVVDAHGEPVANVAVVARTSGSFERQHTRSDGAGRFAFAELPATQVELTPHARGAWPYGPPLRKPGSSDDEVQGESVEVLAGESVEVELVVEAHDASIRGRVIDADGAPVSDAFVQAQRMREETGANVERDRRAARRFDGGRQPVLTDAEGRFALSGLANGGRFVVVARRKGGGEASAEGVEAGAEVELVIVETGELGGTIVHADGAAPGRIEISAYNRDTQFQREQVFFQTDRWRMRELPAGHYTITATGDGAMTEAEVELDAGEVRDDIELTLDPLLTVTGTIVDIDTRAPIAGMSVHAGTPNLDFHDDERVTTSDGRFRVEHVPHGVIRLYVIPVNRGRDAPYNLIWHIVRLEPQPGVQDVGEIPLVAKRIGPDDTPGDLGFTLQDAAAGAEIEDYRIRVAAVRPGGPGAAAGLVANDQIISVDGHDVRGALAPRWIPLTRVAPGTSLRLGLADGREATLVVGPPR